MFETCAETHVDLLVNSPILVKIGICGKILVGFASNKFDENL
jgi:hypothetical protein